MAQLNATTLVANPEAIEHEMNFYGFTPGGFVALSMIVVILILVWKGAPKAIAASLDKKIVSIKAQLDEASKLRAEAEALKAEYQAKATVADQDAASIVEHAHAEAAAIVAKAKDDAEALVARRTRMAEDKIGAAERAAIADLRAQAATAATTAARSLIAEGHGADADKILVDKAISSLGQRLN